MGLEGRTRTRVHALGTNLRQVDGRWATFCPQKAGVSKGGAQVKLDGCGRVARGL